MMAAKNIIKRLITLNSSVKFYKSFESLKRDHFTEPVKNLVTYKGPIKYYIPLKNVTVKFHTSRPNRALPPIFWVFMRPILKFFAIFFSRRFRFWWRNLPIDKKRQLIQNLKKKKYLISGSAATIVGGVASYYYYHLEEHPLTKRKRFVLFSEDQIYRLTQIHTLMELENNKGHILNEKHPASLRVLRVVSQLLEGNQDVPQMKEKEWGITVVESDMMEAFVFLNGHIFVFTGILNVCETDDQLGIILGHEMAHAVLGHVGEKLSNAHVTQMLLIIPIFMLWSVFPDAAAILLQMASSVLLKILIDLPYSRTLETEADELGIFLAAKSCFDVRQGSKFWDMMSKSDNLNKEVEFLSTHPSHEHRKETIDQLVPKALQLRLLCKCPELK